jgi:hypothetical protein
MRQVHTWALALAATACVDAAHGPPPRASAVALARPPHSASGSGTFAIRGARVFDGENALGPRVVVVAGGIIRAVGGDVPDGVPIIDATGRTLLPGLFDAHVHVRTPGHQAALRQALAFGVTTCIDMFTSKEGLARLKQVEMDDPPDMADVRSAGIGVTAPGGHPTEMGGPPIPTLAAASVRRRADRRGVRLHQGHRG